MLNVEIRNSLAAIIRQNGKQIAADPVGLQTLLRADAAQYPREIGMIVNAARAGIPQDIESAGNAIYDLRPRMVEKLQTEQAFPPDVAEWVVETWISALSMADAGAAAAPAAPVAPAPVAPVAPAAPVAAPAPVAQAPVAPAPAMHQAAPQGGFGPGPGVPQYPQYNQFQKKPGGSGKMIAIIACVVVLVAALAVGGYFIFRPKGPVVTTTTTTAGTTGTTGGGDIFNTNGGATNGGTTGGPTTGGGPGTTGGGPGTTGGGPGTTGGGPGDTGGGPGTTGGGPGTTGGGPGTTGGGPGDTGGGGGSTAIAGTYGPTVEGANGAGMTGTLTIAPDNTYIMDLADQTTSIEARGKLDLQGGNTLVMQSNQVTVNGQTGDPAKLTMALVPESADKLLFTGIFADALQQKAAGAKIYWTRN